MANSDVVVSRSGAAAAHARKKVNLVNLGTIDTSCTIDLAQGGLFKATSVSGTITLTLANLPVGGEATLHLMAAATAPTVTFAGVDHWLGAVSAPTFSNSKLTRIKVVNDGTHVFGEFVEEYPAT